ncbi:MAG: THUMP domain-containing protein [Nanoarchaeota archaeon]
MEKVYLVRVSEIFLKGKNRPFFQKALLRNIRACLQANNIIAEVINKHNRIIIKSDQNCLCLKNVFGIANISKGVIIPADFMLLKKTIKSFWGGKPFVIETRRIDKSFSLSSLEISKEIAGFLGGDVSFKDYKEWFGVEIDSDEFFVFTEKIQCYGGLPLGTNGSVGVFVQDENSLKAAWLVMRRGCNVILFGMDIDITRLKQFSYGCQVRKQGSIPKDISAIVVNDTLDNLRDYDFNLPVFRPLVGCFEEVPVS